MLHALSIWSLAATLLGAGLFNAIGTPATRSGFVRWSCPSWWCRVTSGLEMAGAALIAVPVSREAGLMLGGKRPDRPA